jgi:hypothetical protein
LRSLDFYEFVGIILPGSVLLTAVGLLLDAGPAEQFLNPNAIGNTIVYLVMAYSAGHIIAAIANLLEQPYWELWKGMPTDWPITRPQRNESAPSKLAVERLCGEHCKSGDIDTWRRMVRQARSIVYSQNRGARLHVFNGNYGMFRGLFVAELIIATFAWYGLDIFNNILGSLGIIYGLWVLVTFLTVYRMQRFAQYYARELFANVAAIGNIQADTEIKEGNNGD